MMLHDLLDLHVFFYFLFLFSLSRNRQIKISEINYKNPDYVKINIKQHYSYIQLGAMFYITTQPTKQHIPVSQINT